MKFDEFGGIETDEFGGIALDGTEEFDEFGGIVMPEPQATTPSISVDYSKVDEASGFQPLPSEAPPPIEVKPTETFKPSELKPAGPKHEEPVIPPPSGMQKLESTVRGAGQSVGKTYANIGAIPFKAASKLQELVETGFGNEENALKNEARINNYIKSQAKRFDISPDDEANIRAAGLKGKATQLLIEFAGNAPMYLVPIGGTEALLGKLATKFGKPVLAEAMPTILKTAKPEMLPSLKTVASNILGVGAVSGAQEAGAEIVEGKPLEAGRIVQEAGKGGLLGLGGTPIGKSGLTKAATSATGAGTATALIGGTPEEIALQAALMGAASAIHGSQKPREGVSSNVREKEGQEAGMLKTGEPEPTPAPSPSIKKLVPGSEEFEKLSTESQNKILRELYGESRNDMLTGLKRRATHEEEAKAIEKPVDNSDFILLDVDKFKSVNDTYGHPTGDDVLSALGQTLAEKLKGDAIVSRWGGEEFGITPLTNRSIDVILNKVEDARRDLKQLKFGKNGELTGVSFSAGYSSKGWEGADEQLYKAKQSGRDRTYSEGVRYEPAAKTPIPEPGPQPGLRGTTSGEPRIRRSGSEEKPGTQPAIGAESGEVRQAITEKPAPKIPKKEPASKSPEVKKLRVSLPKGWKTEIGFITRNREGVSPEGEVDWRDKRILFSDKKHLDNPDIYNHEIAHVMAETHPDSKQLFNEYLEVQSGKYKSKGYEPQWIKENNFHREDLAIDLGKYLTYPDVTDIPVPVRKIFARYFGNIKRKFSEETMEIPGFEDTRTAGQKAIDAELQARRNRPVRENAGEETPMFDANVREEMATKKENLFEQPTDIKAKLADVAKSEAAAGKKAAGGIAYGKALPKLIPGSNLSKVVNEGLDLATAGKTAYDLKKLSVDLVDAYAPYIEKVRRGKMTWEEIAKNADELGFDAKDLLKRKQGQAYNPEQLWGAAIVNQASLQRFRKLQEEMVAKRVAGTFNDEDKVALSIGMREAAAVYAEFAGARAEAGRSLNILKKVRDLQSEKKIEDIFESLGGREINDDIISKLLSEDIGKVDDKTLGKLLDKMSKATTMNKITEAWTAMILSAPPTHVTNFLSNVLTALYKPLVETPVAATMELRKVLSGKERQVKFGQVPAELVGLVAGIQKGFRNAVETFRTETPRSTTEKIELPRKVAIGGRLGKSIRIPFRALSASDEFFKQIVRSSTLYSDAYKQVKNLDFDRIESLVNNPTKEMLLHADKEAAYRTYTKPLGKIGNAVMGLKKAAPGLQFIIPFIKTPTNIFKYMIERTPVGLVDKIIKISKGKITPEQISEEIAKPIAGAAIATVAAMLASSGMITGAGPKDRNRRNALYATGWMPYSVKIGDTYYSYGRLEPLASIVGMTADFVEIQKEKRAEKINWDDVAAEIAYSIGRNATSKTFLQGFSNMVQAISDPQRFGEDWIQSLAGSVVPNVVATGARAADEKYRQVDDVRETIMSRIPKVSEMLTPKRDAFGRMIDRSGNFWTRFLSPIQYSAAKGDKIDEEIVRVDANLRLPLKKISVPKQLQKYDQIVDGKKDGQIEKFYELQDKQYDSYIVEAGTTARKAVTALINSKAYESLDDDDKKSEIEKIYNKVVNAYRTQEKYKYAIEKLESKK